MALRWGDPRLTHLPPSHPRAQAYPQQPVPVSAAPSRYEVDPDTYLPYSLSLDSHAPPLDMKTMPPSMGGTGDQPTEDTVNWNPSDASLPLAAWDTGQFLEPHLPGPPPINRGRSTVPAISSPAPPAATGFFRPPPTGAPPPSSRPGVAPPPSGRSYQTMKSQVEAAIRGFQAQGIPENQWRERIMGFFGDEGASILGGTSIIPQIIETGVDLLTTYLPPPAPVATTTAMPPPATNAGDWYAPAPTVTYGNRPFGPGSGAPGGYQQAGLFPPALVGAIPSLTRAYPAIAAGAAGLAGSLLDNWFEDEPGSVHGRLFKVDAAGRQRSQGLVEAKDARGKTRYWVGGKALSQKWIKGKILSDMRSK